MKMNWGYKILVVYAIFVIGIMLLVFLSSRQSKDLVTENYYAEELKYQHVIDESSNTASLSSPIEISVKERQVSLSFPEEFSGKNFKGNWLLYYAADIRKDQSGVFQLNGNSAIISVPAGVEGLYTLKLSWNALGKDFYFEKDIRF